MKRCMLLGMLAGCLFNLAGIRLGEIAILLLITILLIPIFRLWMQGQDEALEIDEDETKTPMPNYFD